MHSSEFGNRWEDVGWGGGIVLVETLITVPFLQSKKEEKKVHWQIQKLYFLH